MEERCTTKDVKAHENQGNLKFFSLASPCVLLNNYNDNLDGDDGFLDFELQSLQLLWGK